MISLDNFTSKKYFSQNQKTSPNKQQTKEGVVWLLLAALVTQGDSIPTSESKEVNVEMPSALIVASSPVEPNDSQVLVAWGGKKKAHCGDSAEGLSVEQTVQPMAIASAKVDETIKVDSVAAALVPKLSPEGSVTLVEWGGKKKLAPGDVSCGEAASSVEAVNLVEWGGKKKMSPGDVEASVNLEWGGKKKLSPDSGAVSAVEAVNLVEWGGKKKLSPEAASSDLNLEWGGKKKFDWGEITLKDNLIWRPWHKPQGWHVTETVFQYFLLNW